MIKKLDPGLNFILSLYQANRPSTLPAAPNDPVDFQVVEQRRYKLRHSRANPAGGPTPPACPVEPGTHADAQRNFVWLPWLPGKVSYIQAQPGLPIVTGEMSGCWLLLFQMHGQVCFGHIGTEDNVTSSNSAKAKNAWKVAVARGLVQPMKAFQPRATAPGTTKVFGALSTNNNFYTINLTREHNTYKVAAVVRTHRDGTAPRLI